MRQPAIALTSALSFLVLLGAPVRLLAARIDADQSSLEEAQLKKTLSDIVATAKLGRTHLGISVMDASSGRIIYENDADRLQNPASCMKLVTTLAALRTLGPSFQYKTSFLADGTLEDGTLKGNLILQGTGDPTLNLERVWRFSQLLAQTGLKTITGNLVLDSSAFDAKLRTTGSDEFNTMRAYTAPTSALSVNWNTVSFLITPGSDLGDPAKVLVDPPTNYVTFANESKTVSSRRRRTLQVLQIEPKQFLITGNLPQRFTQKTYYRTIENPVDFAGHLFKFFLHNAGIKILGKTVTGSTPENTTALATWESPPLSVIVRALNKHSSNFVAEQIVKTMATAAGQFPGTTAQGIQVVEEELHKLGIPAQSYQMLNGSGLHMKNRLTANQLAQVLTAAWQDFRIRPEFLTSLPIAGLDGTLVTRLQDTAALGLLRAKTGTLRGVSCLAGYANTRNKRTFSFSILMTRLQGAWSQALAFQDSIGAALADWPQATPAPEKNPSKAFKPRTSNP